MIVVTVAATVTTIMNIGIGVLMFRPLERCDLFPYSPYCGVDRVLLLALASVTLLGLVALAIAWSTRETVRRVWAGVATCLLLSPYILALFNSLLG